MSSAALEARCIVQGGRRIRRQKMRRTTPSGLRYRQGRRLRVLDHLQDRRFGTLSDGEQKRTQIARAVMTDPELLLLDDTWGQERSTIA